ncbi:MAG: hypothetical protein L0Z62_00120 [Gemmataceae bacterium]|nr:hypothetical protein [Gemmataceae bacterium]
MAHRVTCPGCLLEIEIPANYTDRWLDCPRCQGRVVNPAALLSGSARPLTWAAVLGTVLLLGASFQCLLGPGALLLRALTQRGNQDPDGIGLLLIHILSCLILFGAGVLLIRADEKKAQRAALLVAAGAALLAAVLLLVVSGLMVIFVTCLAG